MDARTYRVGQSTIALHIGDITRSKAEVLVSSDDYLLTMGGGVSRAIHRAAGDRIAVEAAKLVPAKLGDVVVTSAGNLGTKYIFHAITIGSRETKLPRDAIVRQTVQKAMQLVPLLGCRSIAFPAIGAGVAGIPYEVVASEMAGSLVSALLDSPCPISVELYLLDRFGRSRPEQLFEFFEGYVSRTLGVATSRGKAVYGLEPPSPDEAAHDPEGTQNARRRHQIYSMLRHLDRQRDQLEAVLVGSLGTDAPGAKESLAQIRTRLAEIRGLRRGYEEELGRNVKAPNRPADHSVFLSSTSVDLQPHRQVMRELIERLEFKFIGMEEFAPTAQEPALLIRRKVEEAATYLGILGMRYGFVEPSSGLSMTELEYRQAIASSKEICMFVMDGNAPITVDMVEADPQGYAKLRNFRQHVLKSHTCRLFTDVADLKTKAEQALEGLRRQASVS